MRRSSPDPAPFALSRGVFLAVPGFGAAILISAALAGLDWWMTGMILSVLLALGFMAFIRQSVVLAFGGMLLCATAGIMGTSIDAPVFGATVRGIRVDQAGEHRSAAVFQFIDGRVLSDAGGEVPVYGGTKGTSHELYRLRIAPIVGEGWAPDRPISAWAVTNSPNADMPRSDWTGPVHAGVRVSSASRRDILEAVARSARDHGLTPARNVVLLHWLGDPEAAVSSQRWRLFAVFCVCTAIWALLVAGVGIAARRR